MKCNYYFTNKLNVLNYWYGKKYHILYIEDTNKFNIIIIIIDIMINYYNFDTKAT